MNIFLKNNIYAVPIRVAIIKEYKIVKEIKFEEVYNELYKN